MSNAQSEYLTRSAQSASSSLAAWLRGPRAWAETPRGKTALSLFDQALVSGASFATSVVLGRWCSPEELGVYFLALTIILIMRGVQAELVTAPFAIFSQQMKESKRREYAGSAIFHQLLLLIVAGLLFLAGSGLVSAGYGPANLAPTLMVLAVVGPSLLFREFIRQYSFARLDVSSVAAVDLFVTVMQVAGIGALLATGGLASPVTYAFLGAANLIACIAWWMCVQGSVRFEPTRFWSDWCKNWSFAKWALTSQVVCSCTPFIMPWILAAYHDEAAAGVGAACSTLIGLSYVFTTAVANLLTPRAARAFAARGTRGLKRILGRTTLVFLGVLGAFCLGVYFTGDLVVEMVYGPAYANLGLVCLVFALGVLVNSLSIIAGNGLWAMNRPQCNLVADIVTLGAALAVAISLIPQWGVLGAALANLAACVCGTVVRAAALRREIKRAAASESLA